MKRLGGPLVLAALAAGGAFGGDATGQPQPVKSLNDVGLAVVELISIRGRSDGRRTRHGSAFYVSAQGHLLTCFHVLDRMPREDAPRLRLVNGREMRFEVVDVDRETDLALLLSEPPDRFMALGDTSLPAVGQHALFGGAARAGDAVPGAAGFRRCTIADVGERRAAGTRRVILNVKVDRFADPGQSGGPLLAEETLAVIGVIRANLESATGGMTGRDRRGYGLAVPLMYVRPFLRSAGALP